MKEKKRKAGRPKLPKSQVKNVIAIRVTDAEKRAFERQASQSGMHLSEWTRKAMTKEHMAGLGRDAAQEIGNGITYFAVFEVPSKDYEWCYKFLPDMKDVSIRPKEFTSDDLIIQEIKRQLKK